MGVSSGRIVPIQGTFIKENNNFAQHIGVQRHVGPAFHVRLDQMKLRIPSPHKRVNGLFGDKKIETDRVRFGGAQNEKKVSPSKRIENFCWKSSKHFFRYSLETFRKGLFFTGKTSKEAAIVLVSEGFMHTCVIDRPFTSASDVKDSFSSTESGSSHSCCACGRRRRCVSEICSMYDDCWGQLE